MPNTDILEELLELPQIYEYGVKISPDGIYVAWTWFNVDREGAHIYVARTDGTHKPERLTSGSNRYFIESWLSDSTGIVLTHDNDGDEHSNISVIMLDDSQGPKILHRASQDYFSRGGSVTPDKKYLVFSANYDFNLGEQIEAFYVYRKELTTGNMDLLAQPKTAAYSVPMLSKTGKHIIYGRKDISANSRQIWMCDIDGTTDREIINCGENQRVYAQWSNDDSSVIAIVESEDTSKIGSWSLSSEKFELLIDDNSLNIESLGIIDGDNRFVVYETLRTVPVAHFYNPKAHKLEAAQYKNVSKYVARLGENLLVVRNGPGELIDIGTIAYGGAYSSISQTWSRTLLNKEQLIAAEEYNWTAPDGLSIQGWLYRTKLKPIGTIVHVHGGPTHHDSNIIDPEQQYYLSRGFNVFCPNYRGSTGFSKSFEEKIKVDGWGGSEQDDILSGIKSLIVDGIAVAGKVGITGTSYGGYSAWHAITHAPKSVVAAVAPICGMTDLALDYYTTRPDLRRLTEEMMGGSPNQQKKKYYNSSPINFIQNIEGRILIVQGLKDPNVTIENVIAVEEQLTKYNKRYEKLVFEDEGHGVDNRHNRAILYKRIADFFETSFDHLVN